MNDAPALAKADVGIAIGGPGADLAAEAGDIVLLRSPLNVLPSLVQQSRATVGVITQNIFVFAFALNAVAMGAASLGWLAPVPAAILHQAGSLLVLLNALRLLARGSWLEVPPLSWLRQGLEGLERLDSRIDLNELPRWVWRHARGVSLGSLALLAAGWLGSGVRCIGTEEVGVVRTLGRLDRVLGPGIHAGWPWPIERVDRVAPVRIRTLALGQPRRETGLELAPLEDGEELMMMTGDGQLAEVSAVVQYRLDGDPGRLARQVLGFSELERPLRAMAEGAVRGIIGESRLEDVVGARRGELETAMAARLRGFVEAGGLAVLIEHVGLQQARPPRVVLDAYRDVSRGASERDAMRNLGASYRHVTATAARAEVASREAAAAAARAGAIDRARGKAEGFEALVLARGAAPDLSDHRHFWQRVSGAMAGRPKLILEGDAAHARQHLLLPGGARRGSEALWDAARAVGILP
jgi:regulator of protease activity HflC (stomatin/prohibitin superfamily)